MRAAYLLLLRDKVAIFRKRELAERNNESEIKGSGTVDRLVASDFRGVHFKPSHCEF